MMRDKSAASTLHVSLLKLDKDWHIYGGGGYPDNKITKQKPKRPLSIPDFESKANVTLSLYLSDTGKRLVISPNAIVNPL